MGKETELVRDPDFSCIVCNTATYGHLPFCRQHYQEFSDVIKAPWVRALKSLDQKAQRRRAKEYMKVMSLEKLQEDNEQWEDEL